MPAPKTPFQPYSAQHVETTGPGDGRPTAFQVLKDCDGYGKLRGKSVLITGCSAGLGVETARTLYETGATLYLTARDMKKLESVIDDIVSKSDAKDVPRPVGIEMHLDSLALVRKGADDFLKQSGGKLNILINNAGVMASPYGKTKDGFESQIGVNHMAHFLLFQLVKPALLQGAKESGTRSRVINLSSAGHRMGRINFDNINFTHETYNKWTAYGQAKTANIYMTNAITRYFGDQGLTGLSLHPGGIPTTELGRHMDEEDFNRIGGLEKFMKIAKSNEQGAATTVWAVLSPHFEKLENGGRYLADVGEAAPAQEGDAVAAPGYFPHAYEEASEDRLWQLSCDAVNVPSEV